MSSSDSWGISRLEVHCAVYPIYHLKEQLFNVTTHCLVQCRKVQPHATRATASQRFTRHRYLSQPLLTIMATSRFWSNTLNISCTVIVAYAALLLLAIHARRAHNAHSHQEASSHAHHGPCPVEHFAWLAIATGATGILAGCTNKRRWLYVFPLLMLATEVFTLVHMSRGATRAVRDCTERATRVDEMITVSRAAIAPGIELISERVVISEPYVDVPTLDQCVEGVRHSVILACLVLATICTSFVCCSSRLASALAREELAARPAVAAVLEDGESADECLPVLGATKPDPLAEYDESEAGAAAESKVRLISRV
jgi:hypothetical protein